MKYHFKISARESGDYLVQCLEIYGCAVSVKQPAEAATAASKKLHAFLSMLPDDLSFIEPFDRSGEEVRRQFGLEPGELVIVELTPAFAFAIALRLARFNRCLSQAQTARRLKLRSRSSYQRLEDPKRTNPTLDTILRVRKVFPDLDLATVFSSDGRI